MKERTFCFLTTCTSVLGTMAKVYYVPEEERVEGQSMEKRREQSTLVTAIRILPVRPEKHMKENTKTSRICATEKQGNPFFRKKSGGIL